MRAIHAFAPGTIRTDRCTGTGEALIQGAFFLLGFFLRVRFRFVFPFLYILFIYEDLCLEYLLFFS